MTTHKPESGGPREPHNIPIRIYGTGKSKEEEAEYRALIRDVRALIDDAFRRGVIHSESWKRSRRARRLTARFKAMDWHDLIEINSDVEGGKPFIKGTRVSVQTVVSLLAIGDSRAKICRTYRIPRAAIRAALFYAAELLSRRNIIEILAEENQHRRI
jgi:uncharacterized protein (DUF433 family)